MSTEDPTLATSSEEAQWSRERTRSAPSGGEDATRRLRLPLLVDGGGDGDWKLSGWRQLLVLHAPDSWHTVLLDLADWLWDHLQMLVLPTQAGDLAGELQAANGPDFRRVSTSGPTRRRQGSSPQGTLVVLLGLLLALHLLTVETPLLTLLLPLYAIFSGVFWAIRFFPRLCGGQPIQQQNFHWLLSLVFLGDLLLLLLLSSSLFADWHWTFTAVVYHVSPLVAFALLNTLCPEVLTSPVGVSEATTAAFLSSVGGLQQERLGQVSCQLLLLYAVRLFARRTLTLLPLWLRAFVAYTAVAVAQQMAQQHPHKRVVIGHTTDAALGSRVAASGGGAPPAAASSRLAALTDQELHRSVAQTLRSRRTSLPANANNLLINRSQSNLGEARGLIEDILANRDLPGNVVGCLRAVSSLLNPHQPPALLHIDLGLPSVVEDPMSGEQLLVSGGNKPRVTNLTFSTVTSATGLPTIIAEPNRARSSSFWKLREETANAGGGGHPLEKGADDENEEDSSLSLDRPARHHALNGGVADTVFQAKHDGQLFDPHELEKDQLLKQHNLSAWAFPIFQYEASHPNTMLTRMAYAIFQRCELFRIFKLSRPKFFNFFHALEKGYWDIPYHNRIHASDVLHSCYYFTCHPVAACGARVPIESNSSFCENEADSPATPSSGDTDRHPLVGVSSEEEDYNGHAPLISHQNSWKGDADDTGEGTEEEEVLTTLAATMSSLELMALFTAAAMHDYDHPGRTNAFLVATEDKMAILYNDRSVLENHHAATSWRLLSRSEHYFIDQLDSAEQKRFRYLVLELILATDLKRHFEIIMDFNTKVKTDGLDLDQEADRMLVCEMAIKQADINSPTKPYHLHLEWTRRICEEFYAQGDDERSRGMSISPYMDRAETQVAKLQDSFIAHMVTPLTVALDEAGLLPISTARRRSSVHRRHSRRDSTESTQMQSELIANLQFNHNQWRKELGDEEDAKEEEEKDGRVNGIEQESDESRSRQSEDHMHTIQEDEDEDFL